MTEDEAIWMAMSFEALTNIESVAVLMVCKPVDDLSEGQEYMVSVRAAPNFARPEVVHHGFRRLEDAQKAFEWAEWEERQLLLLKAIRGLEAS